jgi:hypothetical protein
MAVALDELDATGTLALVEEVLHGRRAAEVEDLSLAAHWADLHASDPRLGPEGRRRFAPGGDRLVAVGGEGAPLVQDLCFAELGIARRVHPLTARAMVADALDLRHRLPLTWAEVRALRAEVWVARKVAVLTRGLAPAAAAVVDAVVAEAIVGESPTRVIELAQAKVIEVDPAGHRARVEEQRRRRYVALSRSDEYGLRLVIARVEAGDAVWVDAMLDRVADVLAGRPDLRPETPADLGRDELRSLAFGWLARPAELLALLLDAADHPDADTDTDTDSSTDNGSGAGTEVPDPAGVSTDPTDGALPSTDEEPTPELDEDAGAGVSRAFAVPARVLDLLGRVDLTRLAPTATLYVHLHQGAVEGTTGGVARVEGLGPLLLDQVRALLGHANVTLKPVVDLADRVSVNAYEHPETVKERVHLRTLGEVFPYGRATGRGVDMDHPVPYDPLGPPGQTGDDNAGPLSRHPHRARTHLGYRVTQTGLSEYVWSTPHGLHRLVDQDGTHPLTAQDAELRRTGRPARRRTTGARPRAGPTVEA